MAQDVCIVRVKNRMTQGLSQKANGPPSTGHRVKTAGVLVESSVQHAAAAASAGTSGYRDVAINLRVVAARAAAMGLEGHVAEVQLLLREFAEVKADDGHARYIQWRNMRGE